MKRKRRNENWRLKKKRRAEKAGLDQYEGEAKRSYEEDEDGHDEIHNEHEENEDIEGDDDAGENGL